MAQVLLRNLNKSFDGAHVVRDVNLEVQDGEFLVLVGPSGCGKTTTLRMIAGLEEASSGDIVIGDRRVNDLPPKDRDIAMVFQNYGLYPHMSVFENMAFGLKIRKTAREQIEQRVNQAAEILGIGALLGRKPRQLSGGQRQRVAVGRSIVRNPRVFLFDEPLSNLDAKLRAQMRVELKRLHARLDATAIYVTHDQVEAMTLGTRVVVMRDGCVQQVGEPMEVYSNPANRFVAGFIGSPAMNFVPVELERANGDIWVVAQDVRMRLPVEAAHVLRGYARSSICLGIRPEDLRPATDADSADMTFPAVVEVVEPLGAEVLLYVTAAGDSLTLRVDSRSRHRRGDVMRIAVNHDRMHFFDEETEQALR